MTDQNLAIAPSYLDLAIAGQINDAPTIPKPSTPTIPKLALVQKTSEKYLEHGRVGDWVIDANDGVTPYRFFKSLNAWLFEIVPSRVFFPRKKDGQRDQSSIQPMCASPNGSSPYDSYIGEKVFDFRDGKSYAIPVSCDGCRFAEWHNMRNYETGEYILDDNNKKRGDRLCNYTPLYALWLQEIEFVALFKPTAYNVRRYMEGRKGRNPIAGIDKYYAAQGSIMVGDYKLDTSLVKPDGMTPHYLTLKTEKIAIGENNSVWVPTFSVNPDTIPMEMFALKNEHKAAWDKHRTSVMERSEQYDDGGNEEYTHRQTPPLSQEEIKAAADTLGGGKNKKRRMAVDEEAVETFEE